MRTFCSLACSILTAARVIILVDVVLDVLRIELKGRGFSIGLQALAAFLLTVALAGIY